MPKLKRVAIGFGIGCGAMLLGAIALSIVFVVWVTRPGELLEPEQLLGPDTTAYVEWTLRLEDPGTEGFVLRTIEAMQEIPPDTEESLPPWMVSWMKTRQKGQADRELRKLFPLVIAWTLQPGQTPDTDLQLYTLSVKPLGNRVVFGDWLLALAVRTVGWTEMEVHAGERIYLLPVEDLELALFIRGSDIFIATDVAAARTAVDRLARTVATSRDATVVETLYASVPDEATLRGALSNERGEIRRLTDAFGLDDQAVPWDEIRGATLGGGLHGDGSMTGTLELRAKDPGWAAAHAGLLTGALREAFERGGLPIELTETATGPGIRIDYRIPQLTEWLGDRAELDDGVRVGF